jgi:predicted nucleic acid-binding protein
MQYMLDTVIFNKILDGNLPVGKLPPRGRYVVAHVQRDELSATPDISRRTKLLAQFDGLSPDRSMTASFAFDISRFDQSKWSDGVVFKVLKAALDKANRRKKSNARDALIGEASIANGSTLVTCDKDLAEVVSRRGGLVIFLNV